ncbi:hypothetical protein ZIOFF_009636 [Zingiber officinale]|uniref:Reverse transcriptase domain-containing protein n=1 Tax=Zingiber officinale TaxID=94328 RepID=A0A8J5LNV7_ZINOF|nr:hypothetical protein ZIOFF_009636 [Zingiber officinale]
MTVCPACGPFYLNKTLTLKKAKTIPPYDKGEQMIEELIDYTNYLQSMVDKGKQLEDNLYLRVRRSTQTAKVPVRRTLGAAGYDIFTDEEVHIMPRQQCLVKTGISLEFSEGYYARIAPRSGSAYKLNFIVNAGVIDSDFRGELVFEKIMTPPVMEVNDFRQTIRGTGSFGSTEIEEPRSSGELIFSAKIGNSKVFSKFDLKSDFHQVMMAKESIPWTAFLVPQGLFEWLVMSFGLKNTPAVFQRKMDNSFKGCEEFLVVYIDDILVFSEDEEQHCAHLNIVLEICQKEGLVLSPTKMKIAQTEMEFLGVVVGNRKIRLQQHIIKKVIEFDEKTLLTLKGLRSFLGILNYARSHIPNLSKILGPLYSKTSPHGDRRFKESDWAIIRQIKSLVQSLPDLELPPNHAYVIIETDGSMEGWVGVCKWKENIINRNEDPLPGQKGDNITHGFVDIKFEHISGTSNELADALSRLVHHITNKASLSDNQRQFLKQVDESMDETQGADDTVKGVLGKTIIALMAKVTFEKS